MEESHEGAYSVQQTRDGGYIFVGYTHVDDTYYKNDAWLVKTDSLGNKQWSKTLEKIGNNGFYYVQQTKDGGYILAGKTSSNVIVDNFDAWLIKTDALGNKQWSKTFGGIDQDEARSVQQTKDGGYVLAVTASSGLTSFTDNIWLIKADSLGNDQFNKTLLSIADQYPEDASSINAYSVRQVSDGGYIVAGIFESYPLALIYSGLLIKTDTSGNKQWIKYYGDYGSSCSFKSAQQTKDGGYILSGIYAQRYYNPWSIEWGGCITKTDSQGNKQWNKYVGGINDDEIMSVQQVRDGSYILAGYTSSYGIGNRDGWLVKIMDKPPGIIVTSPNGGENWLRDTTTNITWTSSGSPGTNVKIELLKGTTVNRIVASNTPNDGSQIWTIPPTQTLGNDYKIRVTSTNNSTYTDTSNNNFIISNPYITVGFPNGGENWGRGITHTISWTSDGNTGSNVKIELFKSGVSNRVISSSTPNDGSFSWVVPSVQALGGDYKIKITSTSNSVYNDWSNNNFRIS